MPKKDKAEQKLSTSVHIEENSFHDEGDGLISFPLGQVISDDSTQRNGTHYDIESMDIEEFNGTVTADHYDQLQSVIAKTIGLAKRSNQLIINGLQFAVKESAFAQLAYDLMRGGYVKDLSIETYGPWPDSETGLLENSKLCGLSVVVTGNNKSATVNSLVLNSLATARKNGLDTSEAEKALGVDNAEGQQPKPQEAGTSINKNKKENDTMSYKTIKNSRDFAIKVTYKNAAGDDTETELAPGTTVDVAEDQAEAVEKQVTEAKAPVDEQKNQLDMKALVEELGKNTATQLEAFKASLFDETGKEPQFQKNNGSHRLRNTDVDKELAAMDWEERTVNQIESARQYLTNKSLDGLTRLDQINKFHMAELKEKGIVKNSVDLSNFGNFVTSPELLTEIEGVRNDYSPLVNAVGFKETLSLEMAWLERNGDIEMDEVEMDDDNADGNLKPISEYSATPRSAKLKEVAAVTPVANAATRFLAVDLLSDVAEGYRTSYQRKLAQAIVARLQQAVNTTGNTTPFNLATGVEGLISVVRAVKKIVNVTPNGKFIMNVSSELELFELQMRANLTGDSLSLFQKGPDGMLFVGRPYILVPDDLMPTLDTAQTKSFVIEGTTVTIDQGLFYADLTTVSGRVSGGLNYSLSTEAAYEQGGTVKSAFQRDELLLRGFFYRNAAVRNRAKVSGLHAGGIS